LQAQLANFLLIIRLGTLFSTILSGE